MAWICCGGGNSGGSGEIPQNYGLIYEMSCYNDVFRVDAVNYTMEVVTE